MAGVIPKRDRDEDKYEAAKTAVANMCEAVAKAVLEVSKLQSLDNDEAVRAATKKMTKIAGQQAQKTCYSIMKQVRLSKLKKVIDSPSSSTSGTEEEKMKLAKKLKAEILFMELIEVAMKGRPGAGNSPEKEPPKIVIAHPWKQKQLLGRGGFGAVYCAVDQNGLEFAVKEVPRAGIEEQCLRDEVKFMGKLTHKNIVKFYGCSGNKEKIYMYMELMQGSISDVMEKTNSLTPEVKAKQYTRDILCGLVYLHEHGVIHRDIKCGNVLLDAEGTAKLADMGLSKVHDQETLIQQADSKAGSICYMSPEVMRGNVGGKRSDIWSVGCTVYEMVKGYPPFLRELSPLLIVFLLPGKIIAIEHKGLVNRDNSLPEGLKKFLQRIFVKMEDRPLADDMAKDPWLDK
ncbi:uncharacterized protein LOC120328914 [Styela clava]